MRRADQGDVYSRRDVTLLARPAAPAWLLCSEGVLDCVSVTLRGARADEPKWMVVRLERTKAASRTNSILALSCR